MTFTEIILDIWNDKRKRNFLIFFIIMIAISLALAIPFTIMQSNNQETEETTETTETFEYLEYNSYYSGYIVEENNELSYCSLDIK